MAFDPSAGSEPTAPTTVRLRTPGRATPYTAQPKLVFSDSVAAPVPSAPVLAAPAPVAPVTAAQNVRYTPLENTTIPAIAPLEPITLRPPTGYVAEAAPAALPVAVIAPVTATPPAVAYIAPAPLLAAAKPVGLPEPLAAPLAVVVSTAPAPATEALSDQTKKIFSTIPSKIDTGKPASGKLAISRMSPGVQALPPKSNKPESYDAAGLSIKVARSGLDSNFELNRAYTALSNGDNAAAISIYQSVLAADPSNQDALFGIAATYHRNGNIEQARPYYGQLLKINPSHREGLNNFLALASDESPQDALAELGRLEERNPDFSPIPAQQAVVLNKLGYADQAREKMLRAIELAPENLTYKYNLAIMLDSSGRYEDASALYRLLIDASLKGAKLPAPLATLQKRLNYITAATAQPRPIGG
ncbi:MAG: tetratricopeptide repeat protein [Pseudomonadota bacterium]